MKVNGDQELSELLLLLYIYIYFPIKVFQIQSSSSALIKSLEATYEEKAKI